MGNYLKIGTKNINSTKYASLAGGFIRDILPNVKENERGWKLKKKHVAELVFYTKLLLEDDELLKKYIDENDEDDCNVEFGDESFDEIKETIEYIHNCFVDVLVDMILYKNKCVKVKWI